MPKSQTESQNSSAECDALNKSLADRPKQRTELPADYRNSPAAVSQPDAARASVEPGKGKKKPAPINPALRVARRCDTLIAELPPALREWVVRFLAANYLEADTFDVNV